jgi:preprotein translocase subunit YajC
MGGGGMFLFLFFVLIFVLFYFARMTAENAVKTIALNIH